MCQSGGVEPAEVRVAELEREVAALRGSASEYRQLFESMTDAYVKVDMTGRIVGSNQVYRDMLGYGEAELEHLTYDAITPERWHEAEERIVTDEILPHGHSRVYEKEYRRKDGSVFPVELRTFLLRDAAGSPTAMWAIVRDITERKQAIGKLEESRKQLLWTESVLMRSQEAGRVGSWRIDLKSNAIWWSPETYRLFGVPEGSPVDYARFLGIVHPEDRDQVERAWRSALAGVPYDVEHRIAINGAVRWVREMAIIDCDEHGRPVSGVGTALDITGRKQAEEERIQLLAKMQEAQRLESLGVLAGGIAHDFNNLLMGILGNAELARLSVPPFAPASDNIDRIEESVRRAADLCRQLLAYAGRSQFVVESLSISDVVADMVELLRTTISKKARLELRTEGGLPATEADATQVRQVIMNLVINASESLPEHGGDIVVASGLETWTPGATREGLIGAPPEPGRYVWVEVRDTGCGMDADTRRRMFEPFFSTKFTGRGLGLAALLGIVRGHRGYIQVASEVGRGTTIRVGLPAAGLPAGAGGADEAPGGWRGRGCVLLVDDEAEVLRVAERLLREIGFDVVPASNGREAVEIFRRRPADVAVALIDLSMPQMDGMETARELHRMSPRVPIVLSSGYSEDDVAARLAGVRTAGFLQKPYDFARLKGVMREAVASRRSG